MVRAEVRRCCIRKVGDGLPGKDIISYLTERTMLLFTLNDGGLGHGPAWYGMASAALEKLPDYYLSKASSVHTADVLYILAVVAGVSLWVLAFVQFWLAVLSMVDAMVRGLIAYELNWWCMVFPLTGFVLCTCNLGQALNSPAILWVGSAMTIGQVALWLVICGCQIVVWVRRGW